ncbi:unnamed protein product [Paramecium octaurelia]|uniref:Uncharacterized protein n=1 Tax=Paramecium octaurelia TaxID=43137 RepID=A0A8S1WM34_PAROT|nr:unnamed protein product [Paramecium octaurelia]
MVRNCYLGLQFNNKIEEGKQKNQFEFFYCHIGGEHFQKFQDGKKSSPLKIDLVNLFTFIPGNVISHFTTQSILQFQIKNIQTIPLLSHFHYKKYVKNKKSISLVLAQFDFINHQNQKYLRKKNVLQYIYNKSSRTYIIIDIQLIKMFEQSCYQKENVPILDQIFQDLIQYSQIPEREDQSQHKQAISSINNLVVQFQQEKEFKADQCKIVLELMMDLIKKNDKFSRKSIQIKAWNIYITQENLSKNLTQ